jgi:hypothetical protein
MNAYLCYRDIEEGSAIISWTPSFRQNSEAVVWEREKKAHKHIAIICSLVNCGPRRATKAEEEIKGKGKH